MRSELTMAPDIGSISCNKVGKLSSSFVEGDKSSQPRDIKQARLIAELWQEQQP